MVLPLSTVGNQSRNAARWVRKLGTVLDDHKLIGYQFLEAGLAASKQ